MTEIQKSLPKWILIVSALFAVIEIAVSIMLYVSPESVVETTDFKAEGVPFLVGMWAVRQFALGFIFAFATYKRSAPMLTTAYVFVLIMFIGDLLIGATQNDIPLVISALIMCIISTAMLYAINRKR